MLKDDEDVVCRGRFSFCSTFTSIPDESDKANSTYELKQENTNTSSLSQDREENSVLVIW